jgi:hypothetical protein
VGPIRRRLHPRPPAGLDRATPAGGRRGKALGYGFDRADPDRLHRQRQPWGGKLYFQGRTYDFTIGGLGVGGFGISHITATGNVYHLKNVSQFVGAYAQGRMGITLGASDNGGLWLENEAGVVMQLKAEREGIALSMGGDAIYIEMNN